MSCQRNCLKSSSNGCLERESFEVEGVLAYHDPTSGRRGSSSGGPLRVLSEQERERLTQAAHLLRRAERGVRVRRTVAWPAEVAVRFLEGDARELPAVSYEAPDPAPALEEVEAARRLIDGDSPVHAWLRRVAGALE